MLILFILLSQLSFLSFFIGHVYADGEEYDYVDQTSNVDGVADIGTHSNFTAMKYGPDGIYDTLTEADYGSYATITYVGAGAKASGTGAVTPALPTGWQANDIFLLFCETANQAVTAPTGWTEVASSPQGTGTAGGTSSTRLTVFWRRATSSETAPTIADPGDHICAGILAFRNVVETGNPWDVTAGDVLTTASTSVTIPGATTTVPGCMVVVAVATGPDTTTAQCSGWTNPNLQNLQELVDYYTNSGNGGGFGVAAGTMTNAGNYGSTTATVATSFVQGRISIALKPKWIPNYQLDLEVQWVNANYTRTNEYLCIRTGTLNSENLQVDVWTGSSWTTVITALTANAWNNVSVSTYLTSSTFTIRFKGTVETNDATQSSWQIDCALLHTWSAASYARTADQTLSISPSPSRQSAYNRAAFQPLQILLTASRLLSLTRIAGQLVNIILSTTRQTSYTRTTSQPLTFITETNLQKIIARYTSQTLTILTESSRSQSLSRVIGAAVTTSFSTSRQTSYNRLTAQALTLIQVAARQLTQLRTANQPVAILTQAARFTSYQRASSTPLSIIADALRITSASRTANQQLTILLSTSRYSTYSRTTIQPLNLFTTSTLYKIVGRTATQALTILTQATRQLSLNRVSQQPLNILLSTTRQLFYSRPANQNFPVLAETTRLAYYHRASLTSISIIANALRTLSTLRNASLQLTILTEASRTIAYSRTPLQALSILTGTARQLTLHRSPTQALTILTAASRSQTLQRTAGQTIVMLLSTIRQATYTRQINQPINFLTTSSLVKLGGVIQRYVSQALTILTQATRQQTLNRTVPQPLNILLSISRQAFYSRTAEVLLQINMQTAIRIIIYLPPAPSPAPAPMPMPSIQLDLIIQTAHITRLWWQKTTTLEVLVINKGTVATDVTFEYAILADQNTTIIAQGTQTVFISGLDKKTVYISIPTPPDGKYTIQFRTTQPVTVEAKSIVTVETPIYGQPEFTIAIIFLIAFAFFIIKKRR